MREGGRWNLERIEKITALFHQTVAIHLVLVTCHIQTVNETDINYHQL